MVNPMSILNKCMGRVPAMGRVVRDTRSKNMAYSDYQGIDNMQTGEKRVVKQKYNNRLNNGHGVNDTRDVEVQRLNVNMNNEYARDYKWPSGHSTMGSRKQAIRRSAGDQYPGLVFNDIISAKNDNNKYDVLASVSNRERTHNYKNREERRAIREDPKRVMANRL